jgi:preprotein translocase subunit SecA
MAALKPPKTLTYFERADDQNTDFDVTVQRLLARVIAKGAYRRARQLRGILRFVKKPAAVYAVMSDAQLQQAARDLRVVLKSTRRDYNIPVRHAASSFALIREAAGRVLGMRHYDVQILGAWSMLKGQVAEMRTGEGKTLCATLAVATIAMSGLQVHVMTVNDYLAERDLADMAPLYAFLGLSSAVVLEDQTDDDRRPLYTANIVYGTNKTFAFDYLRDRQQLRHRPGNLRRKLETLTQDQSMQHLRLKGLPFAIIDEADSVLIDEARTPLIISGEIAPEAGYDLDLFYHAMKVAKTFTEGREFTKPKDQQRIDLEDRGLDRLDDISEKIGGTFDIPVIRDFAVVQALSALHLFSRDEAYIVTDDGIQIVDENTGRTMPDRTWSDGLHQMIEIKEGLDPSAPRETMARITYQRFFRRYGKLAGMTGTAQDAAWELWSVYRLPVAIIPTNRKDVRTFLADKVFRTQAAKWDAIALRTVDLSKTGVPVLIGTRSVSASEKASAVLTKLGIAHAVLSAAQDKDEADIVAKAGEKGAVTIATNMAGRGTDIKLADGIAALGGLHVILSERHDSRRVDRQLEGRCGRQGEPGQCEAFLSLEDELMRGDAAKSLRWRANIVSRIYGPRAAAKFLRTRQKQVERQHAQIRRSLHDSDRDLNKLLAISGVLE